MHKDEVYIRLRKEYMLLSHANKNPEVNKMLIRKLEGSISALEWVLGFDYLEQKEEENNNGSNN
tara:strand:- start:543 stop:734 length:192 start_codon:yes stop_codon:yes gene_type:complete